VRVALPVWCKTKRGILALLLALAFGVFASYAQLSEYLAGNRDLPGQREQDPGAERARQQLAVGALGRIEPRSEIINLGAGITPDWLESLFVARGDLVK
jgi:HlyD family secretion protein